MLSAAGRIDIHFHFLNIHPLERRVWGNSAVECPISADLFKVYIAFLAHGQIFFVLYFSKGDRREIRMCVLKKEKPPRGEGIA